MLSKRSRFFFPVLLIALFCFTSKVPAETTVTVGIQLNERAIEKTGDSYSGFEIELWEKLAKKMGLSYRFKEFDLFPELMHGIRTGEVDLGFSFITITEDRLQNEVDFSFPYFISGLSLLTTGEKRSTLTSIGRAFSSIID